MTALTDLSQFDDQPQKFIEHIFAWFQAKGDSKYDEVVSQAEHALQSAWLARQSDAGDALVIAALFHDVGHLLLDEHQDRGNFLHRDQRHEIVGANWLATIFPEAVCEPVRLHVPAKRWLCGDQPIYREHLSAASVRSLKLQGGPMQGAEKAAFEKSPHWKEAVQLRLWDDEAKVPGRDVPGFEDYQEVCHYLMTFDPFRSNA